MDYIEFASKIKKKYPDYSDMDDAELTRRMIKKYPEYSHIDTSKMNAPAVTPDRVQTAPVQEDSSPSILRTAKDALGDYFKHLPFVNDEGYVIQPEAKAGIKATGEFVQNHPAETALGVVSIPFVPATLTGAMLFGGLAAGARAVDKTNPFTSAESDYKTQTPSENIVDIGVSGGLGLGAGLIGSSLTKAANASRAINEAPAIWKASEEAKDLAYKLALDKRAKDLEAVNAFSNRAVTANRFNDFAAMGSNDLGDEAYKYYFENLRSKVGKYIAHNDPRYAYGNSRYGMEVSPDVSATFIENLKQPIVRAKAAPEPRGMDLTAILPNSLRVALKPVDFISNSRLAPKLIQGASDILQVPLHNSRLPAEHELRGSGLGSGLIGQLGRIL